MLTATENDGALLKVTVMLFVPASLFVMPNLLYTRLSDPFETQFVALVAHGVFAYVFPSASTTPEIVIVPPVTQLAKTDTAFPTPTGFVNEQVTVSAPLGWQSTSWTKVGASAAADRPPGPGILTGFCRSMKAATSERILWRHGALLNMLEASTKFITEARKRIWKYVSSALREG
jgi:hypothetical protein